MELTVRHVSVDVSIRTKVNVSWITVRFFTQSTSRSLVLFHQAGEGY